MWCGPPNGVRLGNPPQYPPKHTVVAVAVQTHRQVHRNTHSDCEQAILLAAAHLTRNNCTHTSCCISSNKVILFLLMSVCICLSFWCLGFPIWPEITAPAPVVVTKTRKFCGYDGEEGFNDDASDFDQRVQVKLTWVDITSLHLNYIYISIQWFEFKHKDTLLFSYYALF